MDKFLMTILMVFVACHTAESLWCYECISTQPGCGKSFNWLLHWTTICPEDNDICVKILERKDGEELITRSCLSTLRGYRTDIPADHYEGCRPAAVDVRLGHYVNSSVKELDIHRNYYDSTTFCFCFLDHRCNSGSLLRPSIVLAVMGFMCKLRGIL